MTHIAVVHNNVDQASSIGKLASWAVETALESGWQVTVVARDLDDRLRGDVTWRRLYVPPRLHALQWAAARRTVVTAMRGLRPDLLHVYQPQLAALANTWHVEYLSRVAVETGSLEPGSGWRERLLRRQQLMVAAMEDRYLTRVGPKPTVLFCSDQLQSHFVRLYGAPAHADVLPNPAFGSAEPSVADAAAARSALGLAPGAFVIGYLGGLDERKGYREAIAAVAQIPEGVLLIAGPRSEGYASAELGSRLISMGHLGDTRDFWASCDVLLVPSRFDPFAMVVTEAASRGVPVVVTPEVGAGALVAHHHAGLVAAAPDLAGAVQQVRLDPSAFRDGSASLTKALAAHVVGAELRSHWDQALLRQADGY
jgi:glycosyltransferase involved in cell wall biosynthesis